MGRLLGFVLGLWLILAGTGAALASWRIVEQTDSMTDEVTKFASVTNGQGHNFGVFRMKDGTAFAVFALSDREAQTINRQRVIMYRIDKNPAHDVGKLIQIGASLSMPWGQIDRGRVSFRLWHGKSDEGLTPALRELLTGETLLVRYYLAAERYEETQFTLAGARDAILTALALPPIDDAREDALAAYRSAHSDAGRGCAIPRTREEFPAHKACLDRVAACNRDYRPDIAAFRRCVASK